MSPSDFVVVLRLRGRWDSFQTPEFTNGSRDRSRSVVGLGYHIATPKSAPVKSFRGFLIPFPQPLQFVS
jgi:hypothetical protein